MTTANTLNIAKVCVSLTIQAIAQGRELDLNLPRKIYCTYQSLNDVYTDNPNDSTLTATSNFLFSICGGYAFEAERILNLGGGGIVATTAGNPGITPYPIYITLASGNISGTTIKALIQSDWYGLSGFAFSFINNNQFALNTNFTYNTLTGIFDFALTPYTPQVGDIFTVQAFKAVT